MNEISIGRITTENSNGQELIIVGSEYCSFTLIDDGTVEIAHQSASGIELFSLTKEDFKFLQIWIADRMEKLQ